MHQQAPGFLDEGIPRYLVRRLTSERPGRTQSVIGGKVGWTKAIILATMSDGHAATDLSRANPHKALIWRCHIRAVAVVHKRFWCTSPDTALRLDRLPEQAQAP